MGDEAIWVGDLSKHDWRLPVKIRFTDVDDGEYTLHVHRRAAADGYEFVDIDLEYPDHSDSATIESIVTKRREPVGA